MPEDRPALFGEGLGPLKQVLICRHAGPVPKKGDTEDVQYMHLTLTDEVWSPLQEERDVPVQPQLLPISDGRRSPDEQNIIGSFNHLLYTTPPLSNSPPQFAGLFPGKPGYSRRMKNHEDYLYLVVLSK